jgi:ferrous iron transport protein B
VLGPYGFSYIVMVIATLMVVYVGAGLLLNHFVKGESPEIFLEIPAYRRPSVKALLKKTWMRVRWFLKEAIPFLFLGVFLVNVLYTVGFLEWVAAGVRPLMEGVFGLPGEASIVLIMGFLRKDLAVGMLLSIEGMGPHELVIAVTMLTIYFPCVATFVVLVKELGVKDLVKAAAVMLSTAVLVGFSLRVVLMGV